MLILSAPTIMVKVFEKMFEILQSNIINIFGQK